MGLFRKEKNVIPEMINCLKEFMIEYIKEHPQDADDIVLIFSDAQEMIQKESEHSISKMLKQNNVCVECGALNILQNFSMTRIEQKSSKDFLFSGINGKKDAAYDLYNYVNDIKLKKGYISKKQHEENAAVALKLSLNPPLGHWY